MDHFEFGGTIAWRPTPEQIAQSRLAAFMKKESTQWATIIKERKLTAD